jgi:hypothetical protein
MNAKVKVNGKPKPKVIWLKVNIYLVKLNIPLFPSSGIVL